MIPKKTLIAATIATCLAAGSAIAQQAMTLGAPGHAQAVPAAAILEDVGASQRVDRSGRLRMLSQRIPAAACNLAAGVAPDEATALLADATAEFEKIVHALRFGDETMGIRGAETRRKTIVRLDALEDRWTPIDAAARAMAEGDLSASHLDVILAGDMELLDNAGLLVTALVAQYSDPNEMLMANSMLVDIAGRQRMLSQKMSKEACMIWSGRSFAATTAQLSETMTLFETSLTALRNGMSEAGIMPPPTAEIAAGLEVVAADWGRVKPVLEKLASGQNPEAQVQAETFLALNAMMADMNAVVGLYAEASKRSS